VDNVKRPVPLARRRRRRRKKEIGEALSKRQKK